MITSTEGGLWVNPTIGLMSKSLGSLVVVKVYLCMRDAKNRNNSVNAKDFPRQSLLPGKNSNIQCHPYQNDTFHLHRNWQKNHSCEIPFTMLKIHEVNICYMDLYLILSIFIPNFDTLNIFLIFSNFWIILKIILSNSP